MRTRKRNTRMPSQKDSNDLFRDDPAPVRCLAAPPPPPPSLWCSSQLSSDATRSRRPSLLMFLRKASSTAVLWRERSPSALPEENRARSRCRMHWNDTPSANCPPPSPRNSRSYLFSFVLCRRMHEHTRGGCEKREQERGVSPSRASLVGFSSH